MAKNTSRQAESHQATDGQYMILGMVLGLCLGFVLFGDNWVIGMPLGMSIGAAIDQYIYMRAVNREG